MKEAGMMLNKKRVLFSLFFLAITVPLCAQTAYVRTTTNAKPWVDSGGKAPTAWASTSNYIEIFPSTQYQTIQGFGGCFCEMGWDAVSALSAAGRDSVIGALFDTSGCNFTFCRMPIGANDFADSYYSLNDVSGDYQMTNFSLKRDSTKIIPFIKAAQAYKPNLRFWASPWTPPSWMKNNNNYYNTGTASQNSMKSDAQTLTAYALYLSKAVQEFKKIGINIEYITCQNEPDQVDHNYPTCGWSNSLQLNFYKNYMLPRFQQDNITTKIILGVYCCGSYTDWITYFMNDATIKPSVGFTSHSWGDQTWGQRAWADYPTVPFMETEADWGQNGVHDWNQGVNQFNQMVIFLTNNKAAVFEQWNMILDTTYVSHWGFQQSCPIHINTVAKKVYYTPHFWAVKHISHYVMVGAKAINATINGTNPGKMVAFLNPNGDIILVMSNAGSSAYQATIKVANSMYKATFPPNSFNTVKIATANSILPVARQKKSGAPVLSKAQICDATLFVTFSAKIVAHDCDIALKDLQGRTVWSGNSSIGKDQNSLAIPLMGSNMASGAYLLTARFKDQSGAMTAVETRMISAN
jgi:glucosylceramidase